MSLDRRIRVDLEREGRGIDVEVERNLNLVEARARQRGSVGSPGLLLVAATAIVLVVALRFGSQPPTSGGPNATPEGPTPSPFPCPAAQGACRGPLASGTYSSALFRPQVRYTVPDGWDNTTDTTFELDLRFVAGGAYTYPDGNRFHDAISIFRGPIAESASTFAPQEGVGRNALDLATWLDTHADLNASNLAPVTIGGAPGYRIDLALPTSPRTSPDHCTTDHGEPRCESLFLSEAGGSGYGFGLVGPETAIVYLIDAPSGDTVMVVIDDVDGVDTAALVGAATPIVTNLTFLEGAAPSPSAP